MATLPSTAVTINDFSTYPSLSVVGSPSFVDDQHNPGAAISLDGVNDAGYIPTIMTTGQRDMSFSFWLRLTGVNPLGVVLSQMNATSASTRGDGSFMARLQDDKMTMEVDGTIASSATRSRLSVASPIGTWEHYTLTRFESGLNTLVKIYKNGIESSYAVNEESRHFNLGSDVIGAKANAKDFYFGSFTNPIQMLEGDISRFNAWKSTIDSSQVLEHWQNESASKGEGFASATGGIIGSIYEDGITAPVLDSIYS